MPEEIQEVEVWQNTKKALDNPSSEITHAEILFYKVHDNACSCRLYKLEEEEELTVFPKVLYQLDALPFTLSGTERASLIEHYDQGSVKGTAELLADLDTEKRKRLEAGFTVDGVLYDSDSKAEIRYIQLAIKFQAEPTFTKRWKAANNVWVDLDSALFAQVQAAFETHISDVYDWLETEQNKLNE